MISFCGGNARRVPQIDKALVGQMFVQRSVDGQATNAAVEDADGKVRISNFGLRISN